MKGLVLFRNFFSFKESVSLVKSTLLTKITLLWYVECYCWNFCTLSLRIVVVPLLLENPWTPSLQNYRNIEESLQLYSRSGDLKWYTTLYSFKTLNDIIFVAIFPAEVGNEGSWLQLGQRTDWNEETFKLAVFLSSDVYSCIEMYSGCTMYVAFSINDAWLKSKHWNELHSGCGVEDTDELWYLPTSKAWQNDYSLYCKHWCSIWRCWNVYEDTDRLLVHHLGTAIWSIAINSLRKTASNGKEVPGAN